MRLSTIWSLPSMTMAERFSRSIDWAALTTAEKMPSRIKYWAVMLTLGKITSTGPFVQTPIMTITLEDVLKNIEGGPK